LKTLTDNDFQNATSLVTSWKRPLLVTHTKPDGDAVGSVLAVRELLQQIGASPLAVLFGKIPNRYSPFASFDSIASWNEGVSTGDIDHCDGVIVLDTCSYGQLEPIAKWLRESDRPTLAIDHHKTRDELATHYCIDESAAANCLILYEWARVAGWKITEAIARALFCGIAMDTGWFRHSNTDSRVFDAVSGIVSHGVSPSVVYEGLYHQDSQARIRLLGKAVATLELHCGGRLATMHLMWDSFKSVNALMSDAEDVVNESLRIASVIVSVLFVEQQDGTVRVNLRSKPPTVTRGVDIDVAQIAQALGGGGHARAAGVRFDTTVQDARDRVLGRLMKLMPQG